MYISIIDDLGFKRTLFIQELCQKDNKVFINGKEFKIFDSNLKAFSYYNFLRRQLNTIDQIQQETQNPQLNIPVVNNSFDGEIETELKRRGIVQYDNDHDEPHWDEGKLYWARKMFKEGVKWANERYLNPNSTEK